MVLLAVATMLDLDLEQAHRAGRETGKQAQERQVAEFAKMWMPFDWTRDL